MARSQDHFERFGDHTLLKHAVLKAYLYMWAFMLLQRRGASDRVFFVDGFAGAGRDEEGKPGSPTIACQVAQEVRGALASRGLTAARVDVTAIERDPKYYRFLVEHLAPFRQIENDHVHTLEGSVSDHIDAIVARTGNHPTLYFLDPFGVSGLHAPNYSKMLRGRQNEIFALFADMGAARLRGVVHARDDDLARKLRGLQQSPSLFPELDDAEEWEIRSERQRR